MESVFFSAFINLASSARTLSAIVIVYVVCNLPRLLLNTAEYLYQDQLYQDYSDCRCVRSMFWIQVFIGLSHLLLTVNSSANFIIYFSVGEQFKSTLALKLRRISIFSCTAYSNPVDV